MSQELIAMSADAPTPTPDTAFSCAQQQALITVLTKLGGRKLALEFIELTEENLREPQGLDNVTLIRGNEALKRAVANKQHALNRTLAQSSLWRRAIRRI